MSTEKMREDFEAKYSLPAGLYWCEQSGQYVGHPQFWLFTDRLEVWIDSRAAIEVELPEAFCAYGGQGHHGSDPDDAYIAEDVVLAIESIGLKVKP